MTACLHWIAENTVSLSLLVGLLLLLRRPVAQVLGAATAYGLWLLVPIHLAVPLLLPDTSMTHQVTLTVFTVQPGNDASLGGSGIATGWWLLGLTWLAGMTHALGRLTLAAAAAHRLIGEGSTVSAPARALLAGIGVDPRRARQSPSIDSPTVAGLFRPVLLLPPEFPGPYNSTAARLVLAHEACHMRRRDNLATVAAWLCTAVFWFNPLVHFAFKAFRTDQELSCDAWALRHSGGDERKEYGRALVKSAAADGTAAVTSSWQDLKHMKERTMMLKSHRHSPARSVAGLLAVASMSVAAATVSVNAFATDQAAKEQDGLTRGPVLIDRAPPKYPLEAAQEKIEGSVVMQFTVEADGRVTNVKVVKSEPDALFDDVAMEAVKQWRFKPALNEGEPVPVETEQVINFEMD